MRVVWDPHVRRISDNGGRERPQQLKEILIICSTSPRDPEEDNREMSVKSPVFLLERPIGGILKKVANWETRMIYDKMYR